MTQLKTDSECSNLVGGVGGLTNHACPWCREVVLLSGFYLLSSAEEGGHVQIWPGLFERGKKRQG